MNQEITANLARFKGKTFRDVSLWPKGENLASSRDLVTLDTRFSTNVSLKQPLVSANMLDITESKMAIAQAFEGGIGVIHRFCPPERQAQEVGTTKRAHNFLIENPYTIKASATIGEARNIMEQYKVGSLLIKDIERLQQYPLANLDQKGNLVVGAAIGAVGDFLERAQELKKNNADVIVMDVTSANSTSVKNAIRAFRRELGDYELVVGNIGTAEQADALIREGVQGLKIGIGPGGPCTRRLSTGIGVPQLFAILEIYWNLIADYYYKP